MGVTIGRLIAVHGLLYRSGAVISVGPSYSCAAATSDWRNDEPKARNWEANNVHLEARRVDSAAPRSQGGQRDSREQLSRAGIRIGIRFPVRSLPFNTLHASFVWVVRFAKFGTPR